MRTRSLIWMVCVSFLLARVLGLHEHGCVDDLHASQGHAAIHYADSGLLFGDSHEGTHQDDFEIDVVGDAAAKTALLDLHLLAPPMAGFIVPAPVTIAIPQLREDAAAPVRLRIQPWITPPLRGPPAAALT